MCRESSINYDLYTIHRNGVIWSNHWNRIIKGTITKDGYVRVTLKKIDGNFDSFLVNRVIYYYFNGDIPEGYEINHKDEKKTNNSVDNLNMLSHIDNSNWGTRNRRISLAHKGAKRCSPTDETRKKMSEAQKKRFKKDAPWNKGKKGCFNKKTIDKMIKSSSKKPINQYDLQGNFIKRWNSIMEAAREIGNASSIMRCCQGKQITSYGYKWKYDD